MKKIIGIIMTVVIATSITGCSIRFGVKEGNIEYGDVVNINESIPFNDEKELSIELSVGLVNVIGYDGDEVIVSGKTNRGADCIKLTKDNNEIKVIDKNKGSYNFNVFKNNDGDKTDIEIKIPNKFKGNIEFSYGLAEAKIKNLACDELKIDGGAGELNINDISFKKLDFDGGVGETTIKLSEKSGDIKIEGGVGEIDIELEEVGGNLIYEGGVGEAKIKIPKNSPVYFNTSSGIGSTNISAITSGENTYKFTLEVGIGEIEVYN